MITIILLLAILAALVLGAVALIVAFGLGGWIIVLLAIDICIAVQVIKCVINLFRRH